MENLLEENKNKYINLLTQNVKREGIDSLIEYLKKSDFFTAPASTRFHSSFEGGLCHHSMIVLERFIKLLKLEYGDSWQNYCSLESATIIALFHDLCKIDTYTIEMRNVKENGAWVQNHIM